MKRFIMLEEEEEEERILGEERRGGGGLDWIGLDGCGWAKLDARLRGEERG